MDIKEYIKDCTHERTNNIEPYFRKIIKNYVHYDNCIKMKSTEKEKCCRFFKYWIHGEKNHYHRTYTRLSSVWESCYPSLWTKLNENYRNSNDDCDIEIRKNYSYAIIKIKRYLDELHSIKNFLWVSGNKPTDRDKCLIYNNKRSEYMKNMFIEFSSIDNFSTIKHDEFQISNDCSLLKFFSYFPEITCPEEPKTDKLKPPNCDCPKPPIIIQKTDCPAAEVKEIVKIPESSPSTSTSQIVVPAILTFLGTLFLCYLLYNVRKLMYLKDVYSQTILKCYIYEAFQFSIYCI
ncbi:hypothetical protein PVBG_06058 [Plasmodium vivax Brazil I]|uniref:Uncharacterized protein n=1 Tax=Plasmodium vivax (strain Brazil I) TaxID=1033975 RepID=A0A0J9SJW8_PLAV1|nr:hypothetical protein PVBG_06058 [Plasmodium vivax Brazil I]